MELKVQLLNDSAICRPAPTKGTPGWTLRLGSRLTSARVNAGRWRPGSRSRFRKLSRRAGPSPFGPGPSARHFLVNAPAWSTPGYRGEVKVPLLNNDPAEVFRINPGDRIAQMVVIPLAAVETGSRPTRCRRPNGRERLRPVAAGRCGLPLSAASWAAASSESSSGSSSPGCAVVMLEPGRDQVIGQPGVLREQGPVQVGADQVVLADPSKPSSVPMAVDDLPER